MITEVDGKAVSDSTELIVDIRDHAVGDTVTLTYERNGAEHQAEVILAADSPS